MNIAVIGSRNFSDYNKLETILNNLKPNITKIISGGAKGADSLAEKWAKNNNIETKIFIPDWNKHGKAAGFIRNKLIIMDADEIVAFWDGKSKGTQNSINLAKEKGIKIHLITFNY